MAYIIVMSQKGLYIRCFYDPIGHKYILYVSKGDSGQNVCPHLQCTKGQWRPEGLEVASLEIH